MNVQNIKNLPAESTMHNTATPFFDKNLESFLINELKKKQTDIFNTTYKDKKIWLKTGRKTGSNILHYLTYFFSKNPIFVPVQRKSKKESIYHEVSKLMHLKKVFQNVPNVIGFNEDFFAIEDCGISLGEYINKETSKKNKEEVIKTALMNLVKLHNLGEYHGGSQVKNFTIKDDIIYLIDFEDSFKKCTDVKSLQFRDLFLFLFSLARQKVDIDYNEIIEIYMKGTNQYDIRDKFKSLIDSISFLMRLLKKKFIWNIVDKDTKSVYNLFLTLQRN